MNQQHPAYKDVNRIKLTEEARLKQLLKEQEFARKQLASNEVYTKALLNNKLCRNIATDAHHFISCNNQYLYLYNYDVPTVIDHICGPIHRQFNVDWKMSVGEVFITLTAVLPRPHCLKFEIHIHEENMQSCEIIKVKVGEKTEEEITSDLVKAAERDKFEFRANCSGGEI